ncbi:hypothetical protein [Paenibacillus macerans]|uniref:hypothetical protein n=1 Tax=Paenibacillus macerans TaxID=44252 RepID=UPI003D31F2FF
MIGYLCILPFGAVALWEVASFFCEMRRFLLFLFCGQKQLDSLPDRFGDGDMMLVAISSQGIVRIFIETRLEDVFLGFFCFWPSCSWTQRSSPHFLCHTSKSYIL